MRHGQHRHDRVLAVLQENAPSLLKIARRHSLCVDDAQDAYQRALEIYLRKVDDVQEATAGSWLRTVVKHEAMSIREHRQRMLGEDVDFDTWEAPEVSSGEDRVLSFDRVTRAAEALQGCKRDEVAAMLLRADGHSYDEICTVTGWSYTKVNRCLAEGRARFLRRYAEIEAGEECRRLAPLLSMIVDGEATPVQLAEARPHLRNCGSCRASLRELTESQPAIHVVLPAALLMGGSTLPDGGAGFFSRVYELFAGGVHDRLALTAMKTQTAVEAVSATKVAAVAASAAAVAGGGAFAVERTLVESKPTPERHAEVRASRKPTPPVRALLPKARVRIERRAKPSTATTAVPKKPRAEFGFEGATTGSTAVVKAQPATAKPPEAKPAKKKPGGGEDFGFER
jgi:DNA-directed RNA polymerase specialized sigma24 family protein/predicted anti-sigma-YlaC factor YlaD